MGINAMGILVTFLCALYIDYIGARHHYMVTLFIFASIKISRILFLARPLSKNFVSRSQDVSGLAFTDQATFYHGQILCVMTISQRDLLS